LPDDCTDRPVLRRGSPFRVLQVFLAGPLRTGGKPETLRPGSVFSVTPYLSPIGGSSFVAPEFVLV
jgi:hypothetical protein